MVGMEGHALLLCGPHMLCIEAACHNVASMLFDDAFEFLDMSSSFEDDETMAMVMA